MDADLTQKPTLSEMVGAALDILERDDKGYFLFIEGKFFFQNTFIKILPAFYVFFAKISTIKNYVSMKCMYLDDYKIIYNLNVIVSHYKLQNIQKP